MFPPGLRGLPGFGFWNRLKFRPGTLVAFLWTLIWTTDGLTNSATAPKASDKALAVRWLSGVTLGAAGIGRKKPVELTSAADATINAAHATGLRLISVSISF